MAEPVIRLSAFAGACALAIAAQAGAMNLPDPTSPPVSYMSGAGVQQGTLQTASGPVLQSVMISAGRRVAVISGQAVRQGEKYGDSHVVKISESEVVLQGSGGTQTLKLFPGVEKSMTSRSGSRNDKRRH